MEDSSAKDRSNDGAGTFSEMRVHTGALLPGPAPALLAVLNGQSNVFMGNTLQMQCFGAAGVGGVDNETSCSIEKSVSRGSASISIGRLRCQDASTGREC